MNVDKTFASEGLIHANIYIALGRDAVHMTKKYDNHMKLKGLRVSEKIKI